MNKICRISSYSLGIILTFGGIYLCKWENAWKFLKLELIKVESFEYSLFVIKIFVSSYIKNEHGFVRTPFVKIPSSLPVIAQSFSKVSIIRVKRFERVKFSYLLVQIL